MVPGGCTKKTPCKKCGNLFYQRLITGTFKLTEECDICKPIKPEDEKKK